MKIETFICDYCNDQIQGDEASVVFGKDACGTCARVAVDATTQAHADIRATIDAITNHSLSLISILRCCDLESIRKMIGTNGLELVQEILREADQNKETRPPTNYAALLRKGEKTGQVK